RTAAPVGRPAGGDASRGSRPKRSSMLLAARGVTKRFGASTVLDGVSFDVRHGEILGLVGPNGAGKTPLFECLAGLLPKDAGAVSTQGPLFYLPDGIRPWADQTVRWALRFLERLWQRPPGTGLSLAGQLQLDRLLGSQIGSLS